MLKLLAAQFKQGVEAAKTGDIFGRVAAGINIQKNLKALASLKK